MYLEGVLNIAQSTEGSCINTQETQHRPNNKKLYSLLKHAKQDSSGVATLRKDYIPHEDDTAKASILNQQFQSVFSPKSPLSLKSLCQMNIQDTIDKGQRRSADQSPYSKIHDIEISTNGIDKLLRNLNPHKAYWPDQITPTILKELHSEIAPILKIIFQKSLDSGTLPSIWKRANVAPIYKKGERSNPANYRPISLTCVLCKTLEHIVASSMTKHFTNLDILHDMQHGFREKRSCETQLLMLVDDLLKSVYNKKQVDLILLDFSKAFDKVNHEKLLSKLHHYGIRGKTLKWIKSFLDDRTQSVVVNGKTSGTIPVSSGVPQGSVLGPILFLVYINDLPEHVQSTVRLFADDTAIYITLDTEGQSKVLQNDLENLEKWENKWDMEFNPSKCQIIHITKSRHHIPTTYKLHNTTLESAPSAKYLGVDIASDMSWTTHINRISKQANQTLGFLKRNIKVHSEQLKSTAYKTLVRPQLEYSSTVWSPYTQSSIYQLEIVQRRAARWATRTYQRTSSVTELLQSLGWRRLDLRRIDSRLSMLYKITNGTVAIPADPYLIRNPRPLRHSHPLQYRLPTATTDYYKFSFFPQTVSIWNTLPIGIPTLPTVEQFNRAVCHIDHKTP